MQARNMSRGCRQLRAVQRCLVVSGNLQPARRWILRHRMGFISDGLQSCDQDRSGLRHAQSCALSVSQNDLIALFDLIEILNARIDLEGSHVPGGTRQCNRVLLGID